MGNVGSRGGANGSRRSDTRRNHPPPQPAAQSQPEIIETRYVYAAARPYTINQPQYYQQPGLHGPRELQTTPPIPLPDSYGHHQRGLPPNWAAAGYSPIGPVIPAQNQMPSVELEREKAVTIRNDVNLKKETLRIEPDENNPGMFLVAFTFDATVAGSITIIFFAKEGEDSNLIPKKENFLEPVTVNFERGLGQKFRQPSGTGIDLSAENESELLRASDIDSVYPLAVKAEAMGGTMNSQITGAVFEKGRGECHVRVAKQILWVNGKRYELQEIYGIGNSHVDGDVDGNEAGKDCVICMSEPRDTTVLPCRHMCMCSGCANVWKSRTDRCPICRQPVDRLLEIRVSNGSSE